MFVFLCQLISFSFKRSSLYGVCVSYFVVAVFYGCFYSVLDGLYDESFLKVATEACYSESGLLGLYQFVDEVFLSYVYFSVVTMSTVGYGDISPNSPFAKILVISQIIVGVFLVVIAVNIAISREIEKKEKEKVKPLLNCASSDLAILFYNQVDIFLMYLEYSEVEYSVGANKIADLIGESKLNGGIEKDDGWYNRYEMAVVSKLEGLDSFSDRVLSRYVNVVDNSLYRAVYRIDRFNRGKIKSGLLFGKWNSEKDDFFIELKKLQDYVLDNSVTLDDSLVMSLKDRVSGELVRKGIVL